MENKPNRNRRSSLGKKRLKQRKFTSLRTNRNQSNKIIGFASSEKYVTAVQQIYLEEINDIERFVKFAESR